MTAFKTAGGRTRPSGPGQVETARLPVGNQAEEVTGSSEVGTSPPLSQVVGVVVPSTPTRGGAVSADRVTPHSCFVCWLVGPGARWVK